MRYTVTMVIEADSLAQAWRKLPEVVPHDFRADTVTALQEAGLLSFTLNGGGKEVHASFVDQKSGLTREAQVGFPPVPEKDDKVHVTRRASV